MGVETILKKGKEIHDSSCRGCYFHSPSRLLESCDHPHGVKACEDCLGTIYTEITRTEFNFSTGKKYRVKKDGRVVDYEAPHRIHINGEIFPVYENDTKEDIENRVNAGLMDYPFVIGIDGLDRVI